MNDQIYFNWLLEKTNMVSGKVNDEHALLLKHLYEVEYICTYPLDRNRLSDGIDLRNYCPYGVYNTTRPCSMLEMLIALANRMEIEEFASSSYKDRTAVWFWKMIRNLGLYTQTNESYDQYEVDDILFKFMNHQYEPNGKGGLFIIKNPNIDMRNYDIWYQVSIYGLEQDKYDERRIKL